MTEPRIGRYRVERQIASGGMGDVYLASDTKLGRFVALKFLPPELTGDPVRRARFLREARLAAALSHPHIATVFDVLEHQGDLVLAMEFIQGESLRAEIARGPLPVARALRLGSQVADALAAAHQRGIVHRDIKPENIMITPDGLAKVVDFGLARALAAEPPTPPESDEPTATLTEVGKVVGTLGYIAPEQLQGRSAVPESDIFGLGATLYEAVTASKPFGRGSDAEIAAAMLRDQPPPVASIRPDAPPDLDGILRRAMAKNPADRYRDARTLAEDLRQLRTRIESGVSSLSNPAVETARRRRTWLAVAAVGVLVVAVAAAVRIASRRTEERSHDVGRLRLLLSQDGELDDPALSPDGTMFAFVAAERGAPDLFVCRTAGGGKIRLTHDAAREAHPAFSPDGERIAFTRFGSDGVPDVVTIPTLGGEIARVAESATAADWSPDGKRLAYIRWTRGAGHALVVSRADGADARELLHGDSDYPFLRDVAWSPDGNTLALARSQGGASSEIWLIPSAGGEAHPLIRGPAGVFAESPAFLPDGKSLVYVSNRAGATNLWTVPVDGRAEPRRITTGAGPDESPAVARDGRIAFCISRTKAALLAVDLGTGNVRELLRYSGHLWAPAVSPDGKLVAFSRGEDDGSWGIWLIGLGGGEARRLSSGSLPQIYPRFTPDGRRVVYATWSPGPDRLWSVPVDGGPAEPLTPALGDDDGFADVGRDGRIAFSRIADGVSHVYVIPAGGGPAGRLVDEPSTVPAWSPDGRRVAFARDRGYEGGIFVASADGSGVRRLTDTGGWPVWTPDGRRIAYQALALDGNCEIRAVAAEGGVPVSLRAVQFQGSNFPFAFSPDGNTLVTTNAVHSEGEIWLVER